MRWKTNDKISLGPARLELPGSVLVGSRRSFGSRKDPVIVVFTSAPSTAVIRLFPLQNVELQHVERRLACARAQPDVFPREGPRGSLLPSAVVPGRAEHSVLLLFFLHVHEVVLFLLRGALPVRAARGGGHCRRTRSSLVVSGSGHSRRIHVVMMGNLGMVRMMLLGGRLELLHHLGVAEKAKVEPRGGHGRGGQVGRRGGGGR